MTAKAPSHSKSLDDREKIFVSEYLVDLDPKRAALTAGYSPSMAASKAYQWVSSGKAKPHVYRAIQDAQQKRAERTGISADRVLAELAKIGFADIRKAVRWSSNIAVASPDERSVDEIMEAGPGEIRHAVINQVELIDSADIDDDTAAAISEVSMTDKGSLKVRFHDKKGALTDLGRHLGIFNDKLDLGVVNVVVNKP